EVALNVAVRSVSSDRTPGPSLVDAADEDVLHLEVFLKPVLGAFAAEPRLLDAAEGRDLGRDDADVGAHDAGLHLLCDPEDAADVAAVEVAAKPEFARVRERDHFFLGLEADEGRDRAERLLVRDQHGGRYAGEHGGLEKEATA